MKIKPDYIYNANEPIPYEETRRKVNAWAKRLHARTGRQVYYSVGAKKVEVYHNGIETGAHNKAVESLARILDKMLIVSHTR